MSNDVASRTPASKRLAVFLDGTWNNVNDNTSVWRTQKLFAQIEVNIRPPSTPILRHCPRRHRTRRQVSRRCFWIRSERQHHRRLQVARRKV